MPLTPQPLVEKQVESALVTPPVQSPYRSSELQQILARTNSPLGMQFLAVPVAAVSVPSREEASTRTCDETTNDGSSRLDCIDDDD